MRILVVLLLCVAAAQAGVEWGRLRPRYRTMPPAHGAIIQSPVNSGRIVGGNEATRHQFPYQVAIYLNFLGFCGGSLIKETVVLTAAHCSDGTSIFDVHLAAHDINQSNEPNRQVVRSRETIIHSGWNANTIDNDIAIVILPGAVSGTGVGEIRMPSRSMANDQFVDSLARVSGWGRVSDSNPNIAPTLKYTDMVVMTNTECADYYGSIINFSKICVNTQGGATSTCNGDSGGPMVIYESDGEPTEIGIVSFGSSAGCESGAPAAFTRVTSFLDWLESNGISIRP